MILTLRLFLSFFSFYFVFKIIQWSILLKRTGVDLFKNKNSLQFGFGFPGCFSSLVLSYVSLAQLKGFVEHLLKSFGYNMQFPKLHVIAEGLGLFEPNPKSCLEGVQGNHKGPGNAPHMARLRASNLQNENGSFEKERNPEINSK